MAEAGEAFKPPVFDARRAALQTVVGHCLVAPYYHLRKPLNITGRENIPPENNPLIVVSNHLSNYDPPIIYLAIDRNMCFVAKKELFSNSYLSWLITLLGAIYIDRQKPSLSSFKTIKKAINAGWNVSIFIEGTRSPKAGFIGPPHTGPAYLAKVHHLSILPVGLVDTNKKEGPCSVRIGKIIEPSSDLEVTTWTIMRSLSELTGYKLPLECMPAGL